MRKISIRSNPKPPEEPPGEKQPPENEDPKSDELPEDPKSDELPDDMKACIQTMCHGISIGSADLFPLSVHQKRTLFQMDELVKYSRENIQHETGHKIEKIQGSSLQEFTKNFSASMGGDANLAPLLTNAAKSEVNVSQKETQSNSTSFAQHRIQVFKKRLQLPLSASPSTRNEIRKMLLDDVREEIDKIITYSEAKAFLANNGYLYVEKAYLGGSLIATSKSTEHKWFKSNSGGATVNLFVGKGNTQNSTSASQSQNIAATYSNDSTKTIGGPAYFGDPDEWLKAIGKCESSKNIIQCMFRPMHTLAIPGSESERCLKLCHFSKFEPIQRDAKYIIQNVRSQCVLNLEGDTPTDTLIPRLLKPGSTVDKNASKIEVEIIHMGDNLNQEHIKAALSLSKSGSKKPDDEPSAKTPTAACNVKSNSDKSRSKKNSSDTPDSTSNIEEKQQCKFLGLKRWVPFRRDRVKISKQSFLQKERNQWSLRRVGDNVFVISCPSGALGAVETKNGEYKFCLEKNKFGSDVSKYSEDFHWKFSRFYKGSVEVDEDSNLTEEDKEKKINNLEGKLVVSQNRNLQTFLKRHFKDEYLSKINIDDSMKKVLDENGIDPDVFNKIYNDVKTGTPDIDTETFVEQMKEKYESYFFENLIGKVKKSHPDLVINLYERMRHADVILRTLRNYDKNNDGKLNKEEKQAALRNIERLLSLEKGEKFKELMEEFKSDDEISIIDFHEKVESLMKKD